MTPPLASDTNALKAQIDRVVAQHRADIGAGYGSVYLPTALAARYPDAQPELAWQYVFFRRRGCRRIRDPAKRDAIISATRICSMR